MSVLFAPTLIGTSALRTFVEWVVTDAVPTDAGEMSIVFERPVPSWGWFLITLGAVLVGWWSYRRLSGAVRVPTRALRALLALARASTIVLLAFLIAGPSIRFAREKIERDRVLILLDRSQSLTIADGPLGISREQQLSDALAKAKDALIGIERSKIVEFIGFTGGAFSLTRSVGAVIPELGTPSGDRTDIESALRQALSRTAGRPVSAVVMFTDGRSAVPVSTETLRLFERDSIPIFAYALGSKDRIGDAGIVSTLLTTRAFVRDRVPVEVRIDRGGITTPLILRLIDTSTGAEIARRELPTATEPGEETIVLDATSSDAGAKSWRVELSGTQSDLVRENDVREMSIEFIDRPVRVLYVEGSSRWEYRYFKNLLLREKDLESSIMLLSADRDFAQEGNLPIARLPRTKEEFAKYDLFVIGDVPSGYFSPEQLTLLRAEVSERGAGLLWIAGERSTPASWEGTTLADLFPLKPPFALEPRVGNSVMRPMPAASRLGVLRLTDDEDGWPDEFSNPNLRWPSLRYVQSVPRNRLKPTAEVLAMADGVGAAAEEPSAVVTRMRFGAGDVVFVATDEIWRWRYGQGERFPERFWIPLVRMLARESLVRVDQSAALTVTPSRLAPGESAIVSLRLTDDESVARAPATISVDIQGADGVSIARIELAREGADATTVFVAERTGRFLAVANDPAFGRAEAAFEVVRTDDELRRGDADHAALFDLTQRTQGQMLDDAKMRGIEELLPLRARQTDESVQRALWDTPTALILVLTLLGLEWCGRRMLRLV